MSGVKNDQTNRDRIKHWEKTQEDIAKTKEFFNVDERVDRRVDRPFQEELKQGATEAGAEFDKGNYLTGAGILAKNVVSAGVNNPMGAFNAVVENSPQLAAGIAFGLPGTLAVAGAYALDAYNEGIAEDRKKNKGAMPTKEKRNELLLQAAALMAAEGIGLSWVVSNYLHVTGCWSAHIPQTNGKLFYASTPLIAAMRRYAASKLGDEVEVPEELV